LNEALESSFEEKLMFSKNKNNTNSIFKKMHFCFKMVLMVLFTKEKPNEVRRGAGKLAGENLKVVWAEFSTLS
jgi:hypothetical protein